MFQLKFLPIFALLPGLFFTNTALGEDNEPKQVERLEVFTTANFKQLCTAPKTYNVPAYAIKSQAAALYLAAADVQHTALLDSLAKHDESQPPLSNAATNLADQPSRFSTRMNQYSQARADSFRETQNAQKYTKNNVTMMVSPRAIVERLQTNLNTFTEDELRNSEENKYLKMAISFQIANNA